MPDGVPINGTLPVTTPKPQCHHVVVDEGPNESLNGCSYVPVAADKRLIVDTVKFTVTVPSDDTHEPGAYLRVGTRSGNFTRGTFLTPDEGFKPTYRQADASYFAGTVEGPILTDDYANEDGKNELNTSCVPRIRGTRCAPSSSGRSRTADAGRRSEEPARAGSSGRHRRTATNTE